MASKRAMQFLSDHDCQSGDYDGEPFVIVDSWDTVNLKGFASAVKSFTGKSDNWGFSDEYTTCSNCGNVIRTSPDSYSWQPDFWLSDGEILCSECVENNPDDYLDWQTDHRDSNRVVNERLLDLSEHGFTKVLVGLENGFHPGQADNPTAVRRYLEKQGLSVAFTVDNGQFDVSFDVWIRSRETDDNGDYLPVNEETIRALRVSMGAESDVPTGWHRDTVSADFREYPDLATRLQAALKQA
jgi:hypothetical protein